MKSKIVLAAALVLLFSHITFAQSEVTACVTGTLESYIALGSEGCVFDNALYQDFTYAMPAAGGGTTTAPIGPAEIIVTPILLPTPTLFPGLNFSAPWMAGAGETQESIIGYNVSPYPPVESTTPPPGALLTLDIGPARIEGIIGSVTVQETVAEITSGKTATIEVFDTCEEVCRTQQTEEVAITPVQALRATLTVTLTGGNGGVSLNSFATDYAFGPQPE